MSVDLGFIDKSCKLLDSRFFPSKVGGKPAWLDLGLIPNSDEIICKLCNEPRIFLCQLYCPINEKNTAFHRTIYVFMCVSKNCFHPNKNKNFLVLRNQLCRKNSYYPDTPPIEEPSWRPDITCEKFGVNLCSICGIRSKEEICVHCGRSFCSKSHRSRHTECNPKTAPNTEEMSVLLPEFGLSIEPEHPYSDEETNTDDSDSESEDKNHLERLGSLQNDPTVEQFFQDCEESTQDKYFINFKSRIEENPHQVIRYGRGTTPLWLTTMNIAADSVVPNCEYCGSKREFEFQILPQLLNYLNIDKDKDSKAGVLDWGTLVIYTCKNSCDSNLSYKIEYIWKQDLTE